MNDKENLKAKLFTAELSLSSTQNRLSTANHTINAKNEELRRLHTELKELRELLKKKDALLLAIHKSWSMRVIRGIRNVVNHFYSHGGMGNRTQESDSRGQDELAQGVSGLDREVIAISESPEASFPKRDEDIESIQQRRLFGNFFDLIRHKNAVVHIANTDIYSSVGGLEKYTKEVCDYLLKEGEVSSIVIYPGHVEGWQYYAIHVDGNYFASLSVTSLVWLFAALCEAGAINMRAVALQHAMNWPLGELNLLVDELLRLTPNSLAVIHDHYYLFHTKQPVSEQKELSNVPNGLEAVYLEDASNDEIFRNHRIASEHLLLKFRKLVFPSELIKGRFVSSFPNLAEKALLGSHYLAVEAEGGHDAEPLSIEVKDKKISIIFHGATGFNKGIHHYELLLRHFVDKFFWVTIGVENFFSRNDLVQHISYSHHSQQDITSILRSFFPAYVFLGSIVPETFSFSVYECLRAGVPAISTKASGNICKVIKESGCGRVFEDFSAMGQYLSLTSEILYSDILKSSKSFKVSYNKQLWEYIYLGLSASDEYISIRD